MINLKKTIGRLFGSCLLCSALVATNCNGYLSDEFYNALSTYEGANGDFSAGWADGLAHGFCSRYDTSWRKGEETHGFISGNYHLGRTDDKPYAQTVAKINTANRCNDSRAGDCFEIQFNGGDYADNSDYFCPLWCVDSEHIDKGGNDLNNGANGSGTSEIFIRGLECIGPSAVHASEGMSTLVFKSVPVALDDYSCSHVTGLKTVIFDGENDKSKTTIPYFLGKEAFPATVETIKFIHSDLQMLGWVMPNALRNILQALAAKSKPSAVQKYSPQDSHNLMERSYWKNIPANDQQLDLFNYLDKKRFTQATTDVYGASMVVPASHLWWDKTTLVWTTDKNDMPGIDLYWHPDYAQIWGPPTDISNTNLMLNEDENESRGTTFYNLQRPYLTATKQSVNEKTQSTSGQSKNIALSDTKNDLDSEKSKTQNELTSDQSDKQSSTSQTSIGKNSSVDTSSSSETSSQQSSNSSSNLNKKQSVAASSAATKSGVPADVDLIIPMVVAGSSVFILKKKKDE